MGKLTAPQLEGRYVVIDGVTPGERVELTFPLKRAETTETAAGVPYRVQWQGNAVRALQPPGPKVPLYSKRPLYLDKATPVTAPRYP